MLKSAGDEQGFVFESVKRTPYRHNNLKIHEHLRVLDKPLSERRTERAEGGGRKGSAPPGAQSDLSSSTVHQPFAARSWLNLIASQKPPVHCWYQIPVYRTEPSAASGSVPPLALVVYHNVS